MIGEYEICGRPFGAEDGVEFFARFNKANPHILIELERRALLLLSAGQSRISIAMLRESMRYDAAIRKDGRNYRMSNTLSPLYARELIRRNPRLKGILRTSYSYLSGDE